MEQFSNVIDQYFIFICRYVNEKSNRPYPRKGETLQVAEVAYYAKVRRSHPSRVRSASQRSLNLPREGRKPVREALGIVRPPRRGEGDNSDASRRLRTPFIKRGFEDLRVVGPLSPRRGVEVAYYALA